ARHTSSESLIHLVPASSIRDEFKSHLDISHGREVPKFHLQSSREGDTMLGSIWSARFGRGGNGGEGKKWFDCTGMSGLGVTAVGSERRPSLAGLHHTSPATCTHEAPHLSKTTLTKGRHGARACRKRCTAATDSADLFSALLNTPQPWPRQDSELVLQYLDQQVLPCGQTVFTCKCLCRLVDQKKSLGQRRGLHQRNRSEDTKTKTSQRER
ncbi:hypothetical protein BaRGS_00021657, partial [Batillaria attramentaria]